jgi:Zn finger protein HypA/HybF involved in hydrogenase expression
LALEEAERELSHKVYQSRFCENDNCVFDIDLRIDEQKTYNKIQNNSLSVHQFVKNTRGAEISKKGEVCQCPNCKQWMPYPKAKTPKCNNCKSNLNLDVVGKEKIIINHNGTGNVKLKVGEDLFRYTSISKSWINTLKDGINYKNLNIYNGNKILVRKTGVGITASMDYENAITNQVVYILKLKPEFEKRLSLEFVLSVLNSRAMTYFLIKKYGENEWKSHPYLTQTMLINLPFPKIDFNSPEVVKMISRVTELVRKEVQHSKEKTFQNLLTYSLKEL